MAYSIGNSKIGCGDYRRGAVSDRVMMECDNRYSTIGANATCLRQTGEEGLPMSLGGNLLDGDRG